jgi:hypothetical protein
MGRAQGTDRAELVKPNYEEAYSKNVLQPDRPEYHSPVQNLYKDPAIWAYHAS